MKYQIYRTTNKINGKIYIGKHQCSCNPCQYFGSGKLLKKAIRKYGIDNFTKTILFEYDNEQEMIDKEKELVTEEFCKSNTNYNLCEGGKGGFGYINREIYTTEKRTEIQNNPEIIIKIKNTYNKNHGENHRSDILKSFLGKNPNHYEKMVDSRKRKYPQGTFKGKNHSEKTKKRISELNKNQNVGKIWITNGSINKMIIKEQNIPEGFQKGITFKK